MRGRPPTGWRAPGAIGLAALPSRSGDQDGRHRIWATDAQIRCELCSNPGAIFAQFNLTKHTTRVEESFVGRRLRRSAACDILADVQTEPHKTARCREQRDPNIEAKTRDVPPSLRLGGDGDRAPRPASETGLPGRRRRARPRAQEARDALAPCLDRPAGRRGDLPCGRDVQEPQPCRVPRDHGRQVPEGRPDAGHVRRHLGACLHRDEALPGHRPGPLRVRVRAQARLLAEPGRGPPLEDGPPDAARRPGLQQGRAQGEDPAPPRGRAPSRSPAGGGGTCRTQARQPRSSS